ncbi:hypothetical protein JW851_04640 [Candidatus Woesearchaeota archaeon]|nr:hypothetical protein [Candidatus Woesearchaeota archaeon]
MGMHTGGIANLYIKWNIPLNEVKNSMGDPAKGTPNGTTLDDLMKHGNDNQIFDEVKLYKNDFASITKILLRVETGDGPDDFPLFGNQLDFKQIIQTYKKCISQAEKIFAKAGYKPDQIQQTECIDVH